MNLEEAETKWEPNKFSINDFKNGNTKNRASMAVDLIKSKQLIGLDPLEIKNLLGDFTGYYWNHNIPAYIIEDAIISKNELKAIGDTWQLIFLLGANGKVSEIKIHKNNSL